MNELQELRKQAEVVMSALEAGFSRREKEEAELRSRFEAVRESLTAQNLELSSLPRQLEKAEIAKMELAALVRRLVSVSEESCRETPDAKDEVSQEPTAGPPEEGPFGALPEEMDMDNVTLCEGDDPLAELAAEQSTAERPFDVDFGTDDMQGSFVPADEDLDDGALSAGARDEYVAMVPEIPATSPDSLHQDEGVAVQAEIAAPSDPCLNVEAVYSPQTDHPAEVVNGEGSAEKAWSVVAAEPRRVPDGEAASKPPASLLGNLFRKKRADETPKLDIREQLSRLERSFPNEAIEESTLQKDERFGVPQEAGTSEDPIRALRNELKDMCDAPWWRRFG